jgi:hypothetical protein
MAAPLEQAVSAAARANGQVFLTISFMDGVILGNLSYEAIT